MKQRVEKTKGAERPLGEAAGSSEGLVNRSAQVLATAFKAFEEPFPSKVCSYFQIRTHTPHGV